MIKLSLFCCKERSALKLFSRERKIRLFLPRRKILLNPYSEVVKRQEDRGAKISNIKAELRDREAFRLEEESKLVEGQGHLQALLKTWPLARGALELAFATPMRKSSEGGHVEDDHVEGDQETSKQGSGSGVWGN